MPFCPNCGAPVEGRFCGKCGASVGETGGAAAGGGAEQPQTPPPAQPAGGGMAENVASALCYILGLITGILFLALAPYNQNKTIRFHAFQSIFFNIAWIVLWILLTIIGMILPWGLGILIGLLSLVIWLGGFVLWLILMWKAYNNEKLVLPVIGPLAQQQA